MKYLLILLFSLLSLAANSQTPPINQTNYPTSVATDTLGNIYIADTAYHRIIKVDGRTGINSVIAGNGIMGRQGDGGRATLASLMFPGGVAVDGTGNIYIADTGNSQIRKVDARTNIITTIAGNGIVSYAGDGGPALNASFYYPGGISVTPAGDIIVTDTYNLRVRKISGGIITTIAGDGTSLYRPRSEDYHQASTTRLINVSTRGFVQTGDNVMIAGFILEGTNKEIVLLRGRGPSLAQNQVPNILANPSIELYDSSSKLIASNDNWETNTNVANIRQTGLAPTNSLEAALMVTLEPGPYTVILRGVGNTGGVGIVEAFVP